MKSTILLVLCIIALFAGNSASYETSTHSELSRHAVENSNLDGFLKDILNIPQGIGKSLSAGGETRTVIRWVQEGSIREDDQLRFFNHFHNPLKAWTQAGLRSLAGVSAVIWAQKPGQGYTWKDARDKYFEALVAIDQNVRDERLAETFRALGQLIHFVQDAAVPAHTRNDPHPPWNKDALERFSDTSLGRLPVTTLDSLVGTPVSFSPAVLECIPNSAAPVRIACIIDTTDSEQTDAAPSAGTNQGLAEYTNANFLSRDTIFKHFTYPRHSSLDTANPLTMNNRRYYTKVADGETGFFLVAEGTFTDRLLSLSWFDRGFIIDPLVTLDYAAKLFPRAVGYSAGLIDYFFRGRMVADACLDPTEPNTIRVNVGNTTENEETGEGEMVLLVDLSSSVGQPPNIIVSTTTANLPRNTGNPPFPPEVVFQFSQSVIQHGSIFIVYKGPLGQENKAVMTIEVGVCG